jgi:ketosteroid isomerase-like protein
MTIVLAILAAVFLGLLIAALLANKRLEGRIAAAKQESDTARQHYEAETVRVQTAAQAALDQEADRIRKHYESEAVHIQSRAHESIAAMKQESERIRQHHESEVLRIHNEAQTAISNAQQLVDQHLADLKQESDRIRQHYDTEARKSQEAAEALVAKTLQELGPLRKYESLGNAEAEIKRVLTDAMAEAIALRKDAQTLLEQSRTAAAEERSKATQRAREIRERADALLDQATTDAGRIVEEAHKRAQQIGGEAYIALRDKETLEQAVKALWNVTEGYGDRYVIPTRSLLDDLAADFGHTEAGETLRAAREHSRRMVEHKQAAACNYVEDDRRERANRFVVDAFNGRVDAILSRTKHDNYGTLEQEIRDAFSLVNLNGIAFRDARILPAYLDARLAELKWAVVVQELRLKEREEQRRIKEQMREEEKARREYERAMQEAQREEEIIKKALEQARLEAEQANAEQKVKFAEQIATLNQQLAEAEAKNQRALSMAQQTRKGNIYIISNVGSFGEEIFKVGMTRRLEPMDRIWELSDASVPFDFDVHAMIPCEDAPALENLLHTEFDDLRINKVNSRKEFFRVPLERLRSLITAKGIQASFTMVAEAHEYRETQVLNKMTSEERERYHLRRQDGSGSVAV